MFFSIGVIDTKKQAMEFSPPNTPFNFIPTDPPDESENKPCKGFES